ncbi:putative ABC transport system permease protein [Allocatelliglobosispora scoriae]|uniref:Putative ABC transport system permease protein n=1 Tax=Allocatelliglobosispora scoriae TaxID=643052 RepID=A0A841BYS9_9ACTN|nr:ABC transporter permease [Allocatelliglobosispora scoriae]MBB5874297.1 putative ABC transport system permease protein [Allocatelliglobosispora scoriae]
MSALGRVVRAGVGRRRVQTVVIAMVVLLAVTAAVLGATLMVASNGPFDRAFDQQHGAHLTAEFDATKATLEQVAASAGAAGVTASAGPFPTTAISPESEGARHLQPITVVGRTDPGGRVDAVALTSGRWVSALGEIVVQGDPRMPPSMQPKVGDVLSLPDLPDKPSLTVVGVARSVSGTAGGWVTPAQVTALIPAGRSGGYQMLYRFASADTAAQIDADRAAIEGTVAAGAVAGMRSWLTTKAVSSGNTILLVPFLIAFGVLGVLMAVLIIGNVIAGAVSTGTRRIGILKALGFTPNQVVRAYTVQALIPASVGAVLGVVTGNVLAIPILAETNSIYGTADTGVTPWVDAVVLAGALAMVAVTAWAAASRAGRLRTVDVLAVGRTPGPGRGQWAARLAGRFPLPRPVTLGLAHPFARPLRTATIVMAIAFGAASATFAVGLSASLNEVQATERHGDVEITPGRQMSGPPPEGTPPGGEPGRVAMGPPEAPDPVAVVKAITAQAGTSGYSGVARSEVTVAGITEELDIVGFTGDNSAYGYRMISGSWLTGPGQIVVAKPFLTATHTTIGDSVVLTDHSTPITVRIVGEVFNSENKGLELLTDAATLMAAEPDLRPMEYNITLKPGTDAAAYVASLNTALTGAGATAEVTEDDTAEFIVIVDALAALLTLLLVTVAALGVLNMVVLETRERVHDLGVHKALGMTPRQTISMVVSSVIVTGLIGGAIGAPAGVLLQRLVIGEMGRVTGFSLPTSVVDVYRPAELVVFGLGGLLIAVVGSLLPAGWAARTRTATALRTE